MWGGIDADAGDVEKAEGEGEDYMILVFCFFFQCGDVMSEVFYESIFE